MADWPSGIPFCPVLSTFNETIEDSVLRTQMDSGPDKTRRRFTAVPTNISFDLRPISHVQYAELQAWFRNSLGGGALAFSAKHPLTGVDGDFRFRRPFRARFSGHKVAIRLELELLP